MKGGEIFPMLYEKSRTGRLTPEEFSHPGKEYRGAPF